MSLLPRTLALLGLFALGCRGNIIADGAGEPGLSSEGANSVEPFPEKTSVTAPLRVWRLTPKQYLAVVNRALGTTVDLSTLAATGSGEGFLNDADALKVDDVFFSELETRIHALTAERSSYLQSELSKLGGCQASTIDRTCMEKFLKAYAPVLLRQASPNLEPFLNLFTTLKPQLTGAQVLETVVAAVLLSPKALFRTELGDSKATSATVTLTPSELAENLSFTLWDEVPDAELMARATDGTLSRPDVLEAQVNRMLAAPNGKKGLTQLLLEWVGLGTFDSLEKDPQTFPKFESSLKGPMLAETQAFLEHIVNKPSPSFQELLASTEVFVPDGLLNFYRTPKGQAPPGRRGLFTQASVIASMSAPSRNGTVARGKHMLQTLLCRVLTPPANINEILAELPPPDPNATTREGLAGLEQQSVCGTCHRMLHPMAFALENFNAIGEYVTEEKGKTIDASGALPLSEPAQSTFRNAAEMMDQLSKSEEAYACFTRQAFRYVNGRHEKAGDDPTLLAAYTPFRPQTDVMLLMRSFVLSKSFQERARQ